MAVRNGVPLEKKTLEEGYDEAVYRQLLISLARDQVEKDKDADIAAYIKIGKRGKAARYLDFTPRKMTEATRRILFQYDSLSQFKNGGKIITLYMKA